MIKKLNKWDIKANKIIHHNFGTSNGSDTEFYHHVRLYEIPHKWDWYHIYTQNLNSIVIRFISLICCSKYTIPSNI